MASKKELENKIIALQGNINLLKNEKYKFQIEYTDTFLNNLRSEIKEDRAAGIVDYVDKANRKKTESQNRELRVENKLLREMLKLNPRPIGRFHDYP